MQSAIDDKRGTPPTGRWIVAARLFQVALFVASLAVVGWNHLSGRDSPKWFMVWGGLLAGSVLVRLTAEYLVERRELRS